MPRTSELQILIGQDISKKAADTTEAGRVMNMGVGDGANPDPHAIPTIGSNASFAMQRSRRENPIAEPPLRRFSRMAFFIQIVLRPL
jgi:hypothetical protein